MEEFYLDECFKSGLYTINEKGDQIPLKTTKTAKNFAVFVGLAVFVVYNQ
jgi:hypothetical protein